MKHRNKNRRSLNFQAIRRKRQLNLALVFCVYFVFFGILCVLVFWGYCYFMLSVPVQLIAWEDRPRNDLLCVERDVKHLLTHSRLCFVLVGRLCTCCAVAWLHDQSCYLLNSAAMYCALLVCVCHREYLSPSARDPINVDCKVAETAARKVAEHPDRYCFMEAEVSLLFCCCNNNNNNRFTALCPGLPGWVVPEETLTHPPSWSSSSLYQLLPSTTIHSILLVQIMCLAIFLHNLSPCPLVYLLVWSRPPHIPYISSPNQCLLFAARAHTIATCFDVVSILYYLFVVFLSTPYCCCNNIINTYLRFTGNIAGKPGLASSSMALFLHLLWKRIPENEWHRFLHAEDPSCYPANSIVALKHEVEWQNVSYIAVQSLFYQSA